MKMIPSLFLCFVLIIIGLMAYFRLAPHHVDQAHIDLTFKADETLPGGIKKRVAADINALHAVILNEPRTHVLSGNVESGHITYVTRSLFWGFPDYTTVQHIEDNPTEVRIFARLRFGQSDIGVNGKRVERWLAALSS